MAKLTDKQKIFVKQYCSNGFNATKAAISAGYSDKAARQQGSHTLSKIDIQEAIEKFMSKASDKALVTIESLIKELDENRSIALSAETPQTSAANAATMGKARLCGLDKQLIETKIQAVDESGLQW